MRNTVLRLVLVGLLAGILILQQGGTGRAQSDPEVFGFFGDTAPMWSPTGEVIAFVSTRDVKPEIYVMNADGRAPRRLTTSPPGVGSYMPAWSPDGRRIAFVSGAIGATQVFVMNADGSGLRLLVSGGWNVRPAWAPDGRNIAFVAIRTRNGELHVVAAEGGQPVNITSELPSVWGFGWSHDGRRLTFATWKFETGTAPGASGSGEFRLPITIREESRIYVADVDARNPRALATTSGHNFDPAWSPDGSRIAFVSSQGGALQIHAMNPDGSGRVQLTSQGANYGPVWSPEGRRIAFLSNREGKRQVFLMNADGSGQLRLTGSGEGNWPAWSPDGRRIVYASKRGDLWQLYSVNADGTGDTQLSEGR